MRALKKTMKHAAGQYLALPMAELFLRAMVLLPHQIRLILGKYLGRLGYYGLSNLVKISQRNLELCFPKLDSKQRQELLKRHYECLGQGVVEIGMAWFMPASQLHDLVDIEGLDYLHEARLAKTGTLIMGLHFTTTELAGRLASLHFPLSAMYQRAKWPLLDRLLLRHRQKIYQKVIPNTHIKDLIRTLKQGNTVWYAPDQAIGKTPVFVPLFGQLAATSTATSQITQLSQAQVLPVGYYRQANGRYLIKFHPVIKDLPSANFEQDALRLNQVIEKIISACPEQYMWQYKRFKKPPPTGKYPYHD